MRGRGVGAHSGCVSTNGLSLRNVVLVLDDGGIDFKNVRVFVILVGKLVTLGCATWSRSAPILELLNHMFFVDIGGTLL